MDTEKRDHFTQRVAGAPGCHLVPRLLCLASETSEQTYGRYVGEAKMRQVQLHTHTIVEVKVSQGTSEPAESP